MAQIVQKITVEVSKPNFFQAIVAKQFDNDSRFLQVTLINGSETINVLPTSTVTINARRNDGEAKSFAGSVNADGTVTAPLTYWMLELNGTLECDISVIDTEERQLTSTKFIVEVERASCGGQDIANDESYDILIMALSEVSQAKAEATEAVENATKAVSDANTAVANANTAPSNATKAANEATTATSNANSAASNANAAASAATTAANNANTAASSATTATSKANTATTNANTAATNATSAANKANTAASNADAATESATSATNAANTAASGATTKISELNDAISRANTAIDNMTETTVAAKTATYNASTAADTANTAAAEATESAAKANAEANNANAATGTLPVSMTLNSDYSISNVGCTSAEIITAVKNGCSVFGLMSMADGENVLDCAHVLPLLGWESDYVVFRANIDGTVLSVTILADNSTVVDIAPIDEQLACRPFKVRAAVRENESGYYIDNVSMSLSEMALLNDGVGFFEVSFPGVTSRKICAPLISYNTQEARCEAVSDALGELSFWYFEGEVIYGVDSWSVTVTPLAH